MAYGGIHTLINIYVHDGPLSAEKYIGSQYLQIELANNIGMPNYLKLHVTQSVGN